GGGATARRTGRRCAPMSDDTPTPREEEFAGLLAACDEALAAGVPPPVTEGAGPPPELRPRLERGLACLLRLQALRPVPAAAGDTLPQPPRAAEALPPFSRLGRFLIRRELGRGGFAVVYLAFDPRLGRAVALKVPHAQALVTPELRQRFQREAEAAAALDHPNILALH